MSVKNCDNMSISPWISRFSPLVAAGHSVLDLAAGRGRHSAWFLQQGHPVTAVDRDVASLKARRSAMNSAMRSQFEIIEADLEDGSSWPLADRRFDAVIVVNYLHRPLWPSILSAIAPGGLLIYETFAVGQEALGKPRNANFLLRPGELLQVVGDQLHIVAFEQGLVGTGQDQAVKQRLAAIDALRPQLLSSS